MSEWSLSKPTRPLPGNEHERELVIPGKKPITIARVWGALVWPETGPGYVSVMAQPTTTWPLYFVAESTGGTIKELVRKALAYEKSHWVDAWYHKGGEALWRTANKAYDIAREMGREIFSLSDAPHADSPGFSVDLLREALEAQHIRTELPLLSSQIDSAAALPRSEPGSCMRP